MPNVFQTRPLATAVFEDPGTVVTLRSVVENAFGTSFVATYPGVWIAYHGASQLAAWNFSYWEPSTPSVHRWLVNGTDIGAGFANQRFVPMSQLDTVSIQVGNAIVANLYMSVEIGRSGPDFIYTEYDIKVSRAQFEDANTYSGTPTAAEIVAKAYEYAAIYSGTINANDCGWIVMTIASAVGAPLNQSNESINPANNRDEGFWRIVHRGDQNPVSDWSTLVQPGDYVRFDWANPAAAQHTVLVLSGRNPNGTVTVLDNTVPAGGGLTQIGVHDVAYGTMAVPASVTIFRLTSDNINLVRGGSFNETLLGTRFNDRVEGLDGNDTLIGNFGNDILVGATGVDRLRGGEGDDTLFFDPQDGEINGGAGFDTARATTNDGLAIRMDAWSVEQLFAGNGNDNIFTFGTAAYNVDGGGGNDTISGNVFGDVLGGNTGSDVLMGLQGNDTLGGGAGSDRLTGGEGADTLFGEGDPDSYIYRGLIDAGDTIIGFETAALRGANGDKIEIQRGGFMNPAFWNAGALDPNRFCASPPTLPTGQFLFDTNTGRLFWDGDGTGAGVAQLLLTVQGVNNLSAADFVLV